MFVVLFFLLAVSILGTKMQEGRNVNLVILALSVLCASALYSFRFA